MATSKRERQRANRELGQQEAEVVEEKVEQQRSYMKFGLIAAAIIVGLIIFALIGRDGEDNSVTIDTGTGSSSLADLEGWSADAGSLDPLLRDGLYRNSGASPQVLDTSKDYEAVIKTENGEMRFRLLDEAAPVTVNNFVNLANDGFYNDVTFHRVLDGFMAQGGDPTGTGSGGPGYRFDNEYTEGVEFDKPGQLAMANSGPDTNGSQFFITFNAQSGLLAEDYTVFGELTVGDDVLSSITLRDPIPGTPPGDAIETITIETSN